MRRHENIQRIASMIQGCVRVRSAACSALAEHPPSMPRNYTTFREHDEPGPGPCCSNPQSNPVDASSFGALPAQAITRSSWSSTLLVQHHHHNWQNPSSSHPLPMQPWVRHMSTIRTQSTPNPQSLMFFPGKTLMTTGSKMFPSPTAAEASPLAARLFTLEGVTSVLFGTDFITVTKRDDEVPWTTLKPIVFAAITDHLASGEPLLVDTPEHADTAHGEEDDEIVAVIKELLETRIRPAVQEDGGDIMFKSFDPETGVVTVKMMGSCSGCPSSTVTLKSGVENMLMHYVPEVTSVVEDEDEDSEGIKALAQLEEKLGDKDV